jgi:hypothetical protein
MLNAAFPASYNLLALLLCSKDQYDKALQILVEGWRLCMHEFGKAQAIPSGTDDSKAMELLISWESVSNVCREDLMK